MLSNGDAEKIQELRDRGFSVSKIAREMGCDRKTVRRYLQEENDHTEPSFSIPHQRKVIPVPNPSKRVVNQREDVEVTELEVRKEKATQELQKIQTPKEHPALTEKKARVEISELNIREFEATKKLQALKEEERRKARAEEEARFEREVERQVFAEEQERVKQRLKWVEGWKEWALTWGVPRGVSIPADIKFTIKDAVAKVLMDRSEHESKWDIEELVKITTQSVLQPFLDKVRAEKKSQLIQAYAFPQIEAYIKTQNLEGYLDGEGKAKIREDVKNHFMKVLTGSEAVIWPNQVFDLLNTFLKPIKEKAREAREEKIKREREEQEIKERAFWERLKEKRKKEEEEQEKERIEELVKAGMNRFYTYLAINRKELKTVSLEEQQRARRYLEGELKEEIEGDEDDREVEKIADGILDHFFFQ